MIYHNKLVRDKIPQIIQSRGKFCICTKLDEQCYPLEFRRKLSEEVKDEWGCFTDRFFLESVTEAEQGDGGRA
jgi:predicted house-cleaning noncanonical NTP pyrophosphatase (MazG superfamily)